MVTPHQNAPPPRPRASDILNLAAIGMPLEDIAARLSTRGPLSPAVSLEDVRSALRQAATHIENTPLLEPVQAGFVISSSPPPAASSAEARRASTPPEIAEAELPNLREAARSLIAEYLNGPGVPRALRTEAAAWQGSIALRLAERLLLQEEGLAELAAAARDPSSVHSRLTPGDRALVDAALLARGRVVRIDAWISSWTKAISGLIAHPNTITYEDHEERLIRRDALEDVLALLSPSAVRTVREPVSELDGQFLAMTQDAGASISPPRPWRPQRWWWYRIPRHPGHAFRDRIAHVAPQAATKVLRNR